MKYEEGIFVAGAFAQLLVANNVDRLLIYAFPVLIPLALESIRRLRQQTPWPRLWVLALVGLQLFWYQSIILWSSPSRQPINPTQIVLFFVLCTTLLLWSAWKGRLEGAADSAAAG